ncbi:hypothetical protein [Gracilibacillus sp. YIM 98692]|uniref:hypothetical protein n=1 Tax=Gracilibacillus sp. YIM 98692 TaxID=2663532 RepID=UPI0013D40835|nr:hypothetical protein [Gracilibacillus sp. YIM 98692]
MNHSSNLNPMFRQNQNTTSYSRPVPTVKKGTNRKTRKDKKKDIKIPLTANQERTFRRLAYERGMSCTSFAAFLVIKGMDYNLEFEEINYYNASNTVHAKLSKEQHEQLFSYSLMWNYKSMRKTAHRILIGMLEFLSNEVKIK